MISTLKDKLLQFREQKRQGNVTSFRVRGAGVASVDPETFMTSRKVANVVDKINRAKLENYDLT